jgi:hypothetical protein
LGPSTLTSGIQHSTQRTSSFRPVVSSRISTRAGSTFTRPADFDAQRYVRQAFGITSGEKPIKVRLLLEPKLAVYVAEREGHPSQKLKRRADAPHRFPAFDVARHLRPHLRVDPHAVFGQHADMLAQPFRLDADVALQRLGILSKTARMSMCSGVASWWASSLRARAKLKASRGEGKRAARVASLPSNAIALSATHLEGWQEAQPPTA